MPSPNVTRTNSSAISRLLNSGGFQRPLPMNQADGTVLVKVQGIDQSAAIIAINQARDFLASKGYMVSARHMQTLNGAGEHTVFVLSFIVHGRRA